MYKIQEEVNILLDKYKIGDYKEVNGPYYKVFHTTVHDSNLFGESYLSIIDNIPDMVTIGEEGHCGEIIIPLKHLKDLEDIIQYVLSKEGENELKLLELKLEDSTEVRNNFMTITCDYIHEKDNEIDIWFDNIQICTSTTELKDGTIHELLKNILRI